MSEPEDMMDLEQLADCYEPGRDVAGETSASESARGVAVELLRFTRETVSSILSDMNQRKPFERIQTFTRLKQVEGKLMFALDLLEGRQNVPPPEGGTQ